MDGSVDPAVLAALPPSMQLDLLVQVSVGVCYIFLSVQVFHLLLSLYYDLVSDGNYQCPFMQMRERLMAENRQKYQKVKKVLFPVPLVYLICIDMKCITNCN